MARTRKNPPAAVVEAPPLDFTQLASNVRVDTMQGGASRRAYNPFTDILRESYLKDDAGENGVRAVDVQGSQVRALVRQLRNAAEQLANEDIGLRLKFTFQNDEGREIEIGALPQVPEDSRPVTVKFLGRPRKVYLTDEQREEARARGFTLPAADGEEAKIDTARYLAWVREAEEAEESENGEDYDTESDDE
jgi:hypothetical protein